MNNVKLPADSSWVSHHIVGEQKWPRLPHHAQPRDPEFAKLAVEEKVKLPEWVKLALGRRYSQK